MLYIRMLATIRNKMTNSEIRREKEGKRQIVLGDNQLVKLTGSETNNAFTLIEQDDAPGVGIPLHVHKNEDELFRVMEGQLKITIGNTTSILKSGDIAFCPRGIPHAWEVIGTRNMKSVLLITPSGLEPMFKELTLLADFPPDFSKVAQIAKKYDIAFIN
jgi:quercetin dioxygenase-like cupin family protein